LAKVLEQLTQLIHYHQTAVRQMTVISDISKLFVETGTVLVDTAHPQTVSGKIRDLQTQLVIMADQSLPSPLRCFMFFLDLLIDDIFYNLSGDAPYNNAHLFGARDAVFAQVGRTFIEIGTGLTNPSIEVQWNSLGELVTVYLNELHSLGDASRG
jgi:hypothetical protein